MANEKDITRRYWFLILCSLAIGIGGWPVAFYAAIAVGAIQIPHFAWRTSSMKHKSVQMRIVFCTMLIVGLWPPLFFVHWIQVAGISTFLLLNFCVLERTLSLLPWNKSEAFTLNLVRRTFCTPPSRWTFPRRTSAGTPCTSARAPKIFAGTYPAINAFQGGPESGSDSEMKEITKKVDRLLWLSFSSQTKEENNND